MIRAISICLLITPLWVQAQTVFVSPAQVVRESERDLDAAKVTDARARDAIKIDAGTASSQVSIKTSFKSPIKVADGANTTELLSLIASAPLAKDATDANLATRKGLASGTTVSLAYSMATLDGVRVLDKQKALEVVDLCKTKYKPLFLSIPGNKEEDFACDTGTVSTLVEKEKISRAEYLEFRSNLLAPDSNITSWTFTLTGGYKDSKYFDSTTLAETKKRNSGGGVAVTYSYLPTIATYMLAGKLTVESAYKDAKSSTACLPSPTSTNTLLTCANGSIGAPTRETTQKLDLEYRRKISERYAYSVQLSRDFKDKVTSVLLPFYLVGNDKDGLSGGISLGWSSDDKKVAASVFVGKAFSVQP